jgi:transposase
MKHTTVGVDIAKNVMQLHYIDAETGEIVNKPVKRAAFLEHFANRAPCLIGMEACGGSQHWARKLMTMGPSGEADAGEICKGVCDGQQE